VAKHCQKGLSTPWKPATCTISHLEQLHRSNPRTTIWAAAEQQQIKNQTTTFMRQNTMRAASQTEEHCSHHRTVCLISSNMIGKNKNEKKFWERLGLSLFFIFYLSLHRFIYFIL
jgi:hypothetical protein